MDKEDKDQLKAIIEKIEESEAPFYEACKMLKELVQEERWEPWDHILDGSSVVHYVDFTGHPERGGESWTDRRLFGNEWASEEKAKKAAKMTRRNNLILQAKTEMGYGGGLHIISFEKDFGEEAEWSTRSSSAWRDNPELTFATKEQAETVLNMINPYLEEE